MNENVKKWLHYEMMGIALTLLVYHPDSLLFGMLDKALCEQDWSFLERIDKAFAGLPPGDQQRLMEGGGFTEDIERVISRLEFNFYLNDAWREILGFARWQGPCSLN